MKVTVLFNAFCITSNISNVAKLLMQDSSNSEYQIKLEIGDLLNIWKNDLSKTVICGDEEQHKTQARKLSMCLIQGNPKIIVISVASIEQVSEQAGRNREE